MAEPALILVLHDVAPQSWADYREFVAALDGLGEVPLTWLVVPDFHHRAPLEHAEAFCHLLDARLARGDELVLHGYWHEDDAPPPHRLRDWLMRRVYTHEGEFFALDETEARRRLEAGIALFARRGWPLYGFVAPAWLLSAGTRRALAGSGLCYTTDPRHFYRLPGFVRSEAPTLVWSAGSAWRRGLSWLVCEALLWRHARAPVLRLALHPEDMRHPFSRRYWLRLVRRLLAEGRRPLTKRDWLGLGAESRA